MSRIKEPQFFAPDVLGHQRTVATLAEYMDCFAAAQHQCRIGEASTAYMASRVAARHIKALSPTAKIIIMLRSPVEVMYAEHSERVFCHIEHLTDFAEAIDSPQLRRWGAGRFKGEPVIRPTYREVAKFTEQVCRYFDAFGKDNVQVILYDDFKADPARVYRNALKFLELPPADVATQVVHSNRRARSMLVQDFLRYPPKPLHSLGRRLLPKPLRSGLMQFVHRLNVVYERRPPMDRDLKGRLQQEFKPEIVRLGQVLRLDLSTWMRDEKCSGEARLELPHCGANDEISMR